jgi:hypothetical protein
MPLSPEEGLRRKRDRLVDAYRRYADVLERNAPVEWGERVPAEMNDALNALARAEADYNRRMVRDYGERKRPQTELSL